MEERVLRRCPDTNCCEAPPTCQDVCRAHCPFQCSSATSMPGTVDKARWGACECLPAADATKYVGNCLHLPSLPLTLFTPVVLSECREKCGISPDLAALAVKNWATMSVDLLKNDRTSFTLSAIQ